MTTRLLWIVITIVILFSLGVCGSRVIYVSSDGGFVGIEDMYRSLPLIEREFERYKFLRNDPSLRLYRTTPITPFTALNRKRWQYSYNKISPRKPFDWTQEPNWYDELRQKAIREYFPQLPSPLSAEEIRLVFYNQYDPAEVKIYGVHCGVVFGLQLRVNPAHTVDHRPWESPVWCHSRGLETQDEKWARVWHLVNNHKEQIIEHWDKHHPEIIKQFSPYYDGLFF